MQWVLHELGTMGRRSRDSGARAASSPLIVADDVPPLYESYSRILRRAGTRRWSELASTTGVELNATTPWNAIEVAVEKLGPDPRTEGWNRPEDGYFPEDEAEALVSVLRGETLADPQCLFLLWTGYPPWNRGADDDGWSEPERSETDGDLTFAGNGHVVLTGRLSAAVALHEESSAAAWWPEDRSWFVASDLDGYGTYVGAAAEVISTMCAHPDLEALLIRPTDRTDMSPFGLPAVPG